MEDLIQQFIENGGKVQCIPTGKRAMTEGQINRACGYAPARTIKFEAVLVGEDGLEFCEVVNAKNVAEAREDLKTNFPEARIESVEVYGSRDSRLQQEMCSRTNNDEWDLY
jgi:uncharacterized phosphosugar-binding protein